MKKNRKKRYEQQLILIFSKLARLLKLPCIILRKDNRIWATACVCKEKLIDTKTNKTINGYVITYNLKQMIKWDYKEIPGILLHEIGHIKCGMWNDHVVSEYLAEKYMLNMIKKYYPKIYNNCLEETYNASQKTFYDYAYMCAFQQLLGEMLYGNS